MAAGMGTPPPRRLPRPILRVIAPYATKFAFDTNIRVSNAKAKEELGWKPRFPSFREGVKAMVAVADAQAANLPPSAALDRSG